MVDPWIFFFQGLGDGLVIPKMVEFKECEDFKDLRLPRPGYGATGGGWKFTVHFRARNSLPGLVNIEKAIENGDL